MCHDLQSSELVGWKIKMENNAMYIFEENYWYWLLLHGVQNVCMYVGMYIHISYFVCGKLTFDYTKWPHYEADHLPPSSAKAMKG